MKTKVHVLLIGYSKLSRKRLVNYLIRNKIKLTVIPNINITFVKEKKETPELERATISASANSLFMA